MTKIVLGFDALEYSLVEKYRLKELKQEAYTKLDLSNFPIITTPPLWASMLTGQVDERMIARWIPGYGNISPFYSPLIKFVRKVLPGSTRDFMNEWVREKFYKKREKSPLEETFSYLEDTDTSTIFDEMKSWHNEIPGYNAKTWKEKMRRFREAFEDTSNETQRNATMKLIKQKHQELIEKLWKVVRNKDDYDLIFWYTMFLDEMGHLDRGSKIRTMRRYFEINELVGEIKSELNGGDELFIISDHGMRPVGKLGLHNHDAFFSSSTGDLIDKPQELYDLLKK